MMGEADFENKHKFDFVELKLFHKLVQINN